MAVRQGSERSQGLLWGKNGHPVAYAEAMCHEIANPVSSYPLWLRAERSKTTGPT